ncbi:PAS domain S-box protein [bacterium]|nr:PAS domain S-box protein [bacterium]
MNSESEQIKPSQLELELASRVELEKLVSEISLSLHVPNEADLDRAIDAALASIGEFVDADRCMLFQIDRENSTAACKYQWCSPGIDQKKLGLNEVPLAPLAWSQRMLIEQGFIAIHDTSKLPEEAKGDQEILQSLGVQSVLMTRVLGRDIQPIGMLSIEAVRGVRLWRDEDRYLLEIVSRILGSALEQVKMIQALSESESITRTILETIPDMIFTIDREGTILNLHVEDKGELILPASELRGALSWDLLRPDCHQKMKNAMNAAFENGTAEPVEDWMDMPSGDRFHYELRYSRLDDKQLLTMVRDISGRKKSEKAIRHLSAQIALTEESQRRKLASRLHDGVSQDLAAASMKLQAYFAKNGDNRPKDLQEIDKLIQLAIRNTTDLTRSLSPPVLHELGLMPALSSLCTELAERSGFQIILEEKITVGMLNEALSLNLYRILRELLLNAIKHSDGNKIRLSIEVDSEAVLVLVEDNGKGIDPTILKLDDTQDRKGFGLFSIRQRLEPLNGSIELWNDKGATVRIYIPITSDEIEDLP